MCTVSVNEMLIDCMGMDVHLDNDILSLSKRVNLDVSTLIAWTSSITNSGECQQYDVSIGSSNILPSV